MNRSHHCVQLAGHSSDHEPEKEGSRLHCNQIGLLPSLTLLRFGAAGHPARYDDQKRKNFVLRLHGPYVTVS